MLILRGEHAPMPSRLIAEWLSQLLPGARLMVVDGARPYGPAHVILNAGGGYHVLLAETERLHEDGRGARADRTGCPLEEVAQLSSAIRDMVY